MLVPAHVVVTFVRRYARSLTMTTRKSAGSSSFPAGHAPRSASLQAQPPRHPNSTARRFASRQCCLSWASPFTSWGASFIPRRGQQALGWCLPYTMALVGPSRLSNTAPPQQYSETECCYSVGSLNLGVRSILCASTKPSDWKLSGRGMRVLSLSRLASGQREGKIHSACRDPWVDPSLSMADARSADDAAGGAAATSKVGRRELLRT
jgi:hypothetical protein